MVRSSAAAASAPNGAAVPRWASGIIPKGQAAEALTRRLKALFDKLAGADELERKVIDHIRHQIFVDELLTHHSREVRTLAACCQAELLRLYALFAEDLPFDDLEIRKMFSFFAAVMTSPKSGLSKNDGPLFADCNRLLETLIDARCFAIPADIDEADAITVEYFQKFFGLMKADIQKNVQVMCAKALSMLVQYSQMLPKQVIQLLIANFSIQVKRTNRSAHQLAALVAVTCAAELQAPVAQHFADLFFKAVQVSDDNEREEKLHEAHALLVQVNKACPALLTNVMPQLEEELRAADEKLRLIAVRTLGLVFADTSSGDADYFKRHASTWKAYLGRSNDKDARIRVAWVDALHAIISRHHGLTAELAPVWASKLTDADERVRLSAVAAFRKVNLLVLRDPHLESVLQGLRDRARDGKQNVRTEALNALGHIYEVAYPDFESSDASTCEAFGWVLSAIIESLMTGDESHSGANMIVQGIIRKYIITLPDASMREPDEHHAQRLKTALQIVEPEHATALVRICNLGATKVPVSAFIETSREFNGGTVEASQGDVLRAKITRLIRQLATLFSEPERAAQDLNAFTKTNDARLYTLLEKIVDETTPLTTVSKAFNELTKRLRPSGQPESRFANTIENLAATAGYLYINSSSVPALYESIQHAETSAAPTNLTSNAAKLLSAISSSRPRMLQPHAVWLLERACAASSSSAVRIAALQGLASLARSGNLEEQALSADKRLASVQKSVLEGSYQESKFAAKIVCLVAADMSHEGYAAAYEAAESIAASFAGDLEEGDSSRHESMLAAMTQIVKRLPDVAAPHVAELTTFCVKSILMVPFSLPTSLVDTYWLKDGEITSELQSRLAALRFLAARCIHHPDDETIGDILEPVLRLLLTCLTDGEPRAGIYTGDAAKARIRQEAAILLLKISRRSACDTKLATADFQRISTVLQDECFHVREAALHRLLKYAVRKAAKLPPRFYSLAFLVALDPEADLREKVRDTYARLQGSMPPELRLRYFDVALSRFLHVLNHHPDFDNIWTDDGVSLDMLIEASKYLEFYLDCCANSANLACLYHIAHRTKGMRDIFDENQSGLMAQDGPASNGLHALCDLAMCLIKRRADVQGCVVGNYPGSVSLPRDLYVPYSTREEQNKVYKKSYLNDEALDYFSQPIRRDAHRVNGKRKMLGEIKANGATPNGVKKPKKTKQSKATKTKKRAPRYQEDDDDDEEDDVPNDNENTDDDAANDTRDRSSVTNGTDSGVVSDDESVTSTSPQTGGSARVRERQRKEKLARNANRQARRSAKAARRT